MMDTNSLPKAGRMFLMVWGHDDQPHALHPGHTQAVGSFLLSRVHCLDTSADDLGDIDAGVKGDGQNHSVGGG